MTKSVGFVGELDKVWPLAETFAGPAGRVATVEDVVALRLKSLPNDVKMPLIWGRYLTTTSAEFLGLSTTGIPLLIVSHGKHPLHTRKKCLKAYKSQRENKRSADASTSGNRVTRQEFLDLESGKYGPVSIVPLKEVQARHQYPFISAMTAIEAVSEPLVHARLGSKAISYLAALKRFADEYQRTKHPEEKNGPYIIETSDPSSFHYSWEKQVAGLTDEALGHLLVMNQIQLTHIGDYNVRAPQNIAEIGIHDSGDHSRMLSIQNGANPDAFLKDSSSDSVPDHWIPAKCKQVPMRRIEKLDSKWFSQTVKSGARMDSGVRELRVKSVKKLGTTSFLTAVGGYYGFVKYDLKEVSAVAPKGANAYTLDEAVIADADAKHQRLDVTFYKAEFDLTKRLLTPEEIEADPELYLQLLTS